MQIVKTLRPTILVAALLGTLALISERSAYTVPAQSAMTLEQVRILTPSSLISHALADDAGSWFERLRVPISRAGAWDDPVLLFLIVGQVLIAGVALKSS